MPGVPHLRAADQYWSGPAGNSAIQQAESFTVMCFNHPQTTPHHSIHGKIVLHETSPWCQTGDRCPLLCNYQLSSLRRLATVQPPGLPLPDSLRDQTAPKWSERGSLHAIGLTGCLKHSMCWTKSIRMVFNQRQTYTSDSGLGRQLLLLEPFSIQIQQ